MNSSGIDAVSLYTALHEDAVNTLIGIHHGLANCGIQAGVFQASSCIGLRYNFLASWKSIATVFVNSERITGYCSNWRKVVATV